MSVTLQELQAHVKSCWKCYAAKGRANDFCPSGYVMFLDWAADQEPVSVTVLSEAESAKLIMEAECKKKKANSQYSQ